MAALLPGLISFAGGCTHGPQTLSSPDKVLLKGTWNAYVSKVDAWSVNDPTPSSLNEMHTFIPGHNNVEVWPGVHELTVARQTNNGGSTSTVTVSIGGSPTARSYEHVIIFPFRCDAGHTYQIETNDMFDDRLKITDENTGQSMIVP